jgi:hypothetical protein
MTKSKKPAKPAKKSSKARRAKGEIATEKLDDVSGGALSISPGIVPTSGVALV